ncbi:MAG: Ppx/GppA family phosphatase [Gammaproteobacteria bacterium]|nr:Ppx/GppA family phosphatase [Gammaproteobacteria bacterium]MDH3806250.1 Ppx/GppA family phosphatase [Gammaproteobacteria bacterium]
MRRQPAVVDSPSRPESSPEVIAAVDLGSNSFHMIVGELRHGQLIIIDRIRETVRLAEGLSATGDLSAEARARAIDCLSRFGERLRDMHAASVRAAGTSTIRRAREDTGFIADAESALGHPIETISGIEEARLIYQGVTHSLPPREGLRLVLDIGGGSTELILGQGAAPRALESLHLGCVSMTERFFSDGRISREAFDKVRVAARLELRPVKAFFRGAGEIESIGTSGTIRSAESVANELGIIDSQGLTPDALEQLIERVLEFASIEELTLPGLSERRAQVWPGGLAILAELLGVLRVSALQVSDGALREGLLYDLLGRLQHEDARERSVRAMAARYNVDQAQAKRVTATADVLLSQCVEKWRLEVPMSSSILNWSARLHEIGLDISHDGFERHGAYVAEHADLPGFPRAEQRFLAFLIGSQRHEIDTRFNNQLPRAWRETALRLAMLLRLAVLLNRSRSQLDIPGIELAVKDRSLELHFDPAWLQANPLTVSDLEREQGYLHAVGYELSFT